MTVWLAVPSAWPARHELGRTLDRYARQRGLIAQDLVADADLAVYGTGPALSYLLQCLALVGAATRHGRIRLCLDNRPINDDDLAGQFLLQPDDLGRPIGVALADRITLIDATIDIAEAAGPTSRSLGIAVPGAAELPGLQGNSSIAVWGQVLPTSVFIGPRPLSTVPDGGRNLLTAALAATCGGLMAQAALCQLGAVVDGPTVLSSWLEEHLWLSYPTIGALARAAEAEGAEFPALGGVLERMDTADTRERFRVLVDGRPVAPRVTMIVDDDTVVVTVPVRQETAPPPRATVRPSLAAPPPVKPLLWSPIEGPALDGSHIVGDNAVLPDQLPAARIVLCGAGALGSWASAVIAASRFPDIDICVVDMDDAVEAHNLNRQVLFRDADVGKPKAIRAVERLSAIDPGIRFKALQVMIGPDMLDDLVGGTVRHEIADDALQATFNAYRTQIDALIKALSQATVILSCPDNHQTRWSLNVIAEHLGIPLINGAVDGFIGRVHVCDPSDHGRCLVCWLGESIAQEPGRRSCTDILGDTPVPSIVTSAAVIGAAQAATLIAQVAGQGNRMRRFHVFDGAGSSLTGYRAANRDPEECPAHLFNPASESVA